MTPSPRRTPWPAHRSGARRVASPAERRRSIARALRLGAASALRIGAALVLSAGLCWSIWKAHLFATTAEAFAVSAVRFEGLRHAAEGELLARSGLRLGENIFGADLAAAARGIAQHPWIASARLTRRLPDQLVVEVREHEAQALVELGSLYASDSAGRLFKRATRADALDLPLFTGLSREGWRRDPALAQRNLLLQLRLLDQWRAQGLPPAALSEVRADEDGGLTIFTQGESAIEARMGKDAFAERLRRLGQIRAALAKRGEHATRVQLDLVRTGGSSWATAQIASE